MAQCQQISLCPVAYTFYTNQEHASVVSVMCFSPGMSVLPTVYWLAKTNSDHTARNVQERGDLLEKLSLTRTWLVLPLVFMFMSIQGPELRQP